MNDYPDNESVAAAIVACLTARGPADADVLWSRIASVDGKKLEFDQLMLCIGMAAGGRKIIQADPEQPWTGEWADVVWKVA